MKIKEMWSVAVLAAGLVASNVAMANMPDFYAEPGLNPSRSYYQPTDFDHVDPFTGMLQLHHTDILIPGNGGLNLEMGRSYSSGDGWTMGSFGYVYQTATMGMCTKGKISNIDNPVLVLPDGSRHVLSDSDTPASYLYITNQYWKAVCAPLANGLIVTSPEGTIYEMTYQASDTTYWKWYVQKITDRNGNWINITYTNPNGNGALVGNVSTSDGRTLTYYYTNYATSFYRVTSISDGSRTWRYGYIDYTTTGFSGLSVGVSLLNTVTLPDNTTWVYTYYGNRGTLAGSYKIYSVKTPQGGLITYDYQYTTFNAGNPIQSQTISSRTITGVGAWGYTYAPGSGYGLLDTTTVTAPNSLQTIVYSHYGYTTVKITGGMSALWKVGLLAQKTTGNIQTETYAWIPLNLSTQNDQRPFSYTAEVDDYFRKALLSSKTIARNGATYSTTYSNFDGYGNPQTITEAGQNGGNRTTTLTYNNSDPTIWILHQVQNESFTGSSITRLFDPNHNLTSITVNGVTTGHAYYPPGNANGGGSIATTTFPRSLIHNYSNYYRGIPQTETQPATESQPSGTTIIRVVSSAGNVTSETNARNFTTTYGYDDLNRPTSITYPAGHNPVGIVYTATSKTATRGLLVESTTYDGFGRPTNVTLGGISTTYRYDALGRMNFKSNPNTPATGTSYLYDALDRITKITNADNTFMGIAYGAASKTVTDERNNPTTYAYRAYGDPNQTYLMSITAPVAAANVVIGRNTRDQITSVAQGSDALGWVTRNYAYTNPTNPYLSSVTDPETGTTTYGRDQAGNMTTRQVGSSVLSTYTYDNQNRLSYVTFSDSTATIHQTYYPTHKLSTITSGTTTRTLGYDSVDNLTSDVLSIDGYTFSSGYGYNLNDQLSSITYPQSNRTVSFSPDTLGRPTAISGYVSNTSYFPSGQVNQITYQNGTISTYGQHPMRLWPSTFDTRNSAATYYLNSSYGYDLVGNLSTITDTITAEFNRVFGYDAINRLTTINASSSWGNGIIGYDGKGNITSQTFDTAGITYTYSPTTNLLSSVSGALRNASYTYDSYGDIKTDGAGKTFTYDGMPNLTGINDTNTGTAITYAYDGLGKRTKVIKNGITTYEFYDFKGKLLEEYTPGSPSKLVEYIYLGGMRIAQRLSYQ